MRLFSLSSLSSFSRLRPRPRSSFLQGRIPESYVSTNLEREIGSDLRSVEEIYQRKTPIEHVLLRPDTYVGSTSEQVHRQWVIRGWNLHHHGHASKQGSGASMPPFESSYAIHGDLRLVSEDVHFVPALYKIFDEILTNAVDNHRRPAKGTTMLHIDIDPASGWISILNNGRGVPVVLHETENMYVPELVFGNLLTGSNFDDSEVKFTGGRNGFGAKLANIFSSKFVLETADSKNKVSYRQSKERTLSYISMSCILFHEQVWTDNMQNVEQPVLSSHGDDSLAAGSFKDYTRVSFLPDYKRFGYAHGLKEAIEFSHSSHPSSSSKSAHDMLSVLFRRVFDVSACNPKLHVMLNGENIPVRCFSDYVEMFLQDEISSLDESTSDSVFYMHTKLSRDWEIALAPSTSGSFCQVSFANSVATQRGGSHVQLLLDQIVPRMTEILRKQNRGLDLHPSHVRNNLQIFVNAMVQNPTFDSQTKETLTLEFDKQWNATGGSRIHIPDAFLERVLEQTPLGEQIVNFSRFRLQSELDRTKVTRKSRITSIPKLDDANEAGGTRSQECTLIVTEGDSAKALAVAGLSELNKNFYGVFPLKGKVLNVRDAPHRQIIENVELNHLKIILGLQHTLTYDTPEERSSLRYGKLMIMCDQDFDGSHIKGLILNMFDTFWPALLRSNDFLEEFITPILKVFRRGSSASVTSGKTRKSSNAGREFFTISDFVEWRKTISDEEASKYTVKYYKGLGTSTAAEGKEYFRNLSRHRIRFHYASEVDAALLQLAFSKKKVEERKSWLDGNPSSSVRSVDVSRGVLGINDFINSELILYSHADNVRAIPSLIDGLKPGQRKVLFGCFKRKLTSEVKVAQLSGYVAEHAAYHHGEASLHSTIINMAQDFVGSNNVPLLAANGQFGTRLQGGKDHASARYIFTRLEPVTRLLYPEVDDSVLDPIEEDGQFVEPKYYVPVIPVVLLNGAEGVGTGYSTSIPPHNPLDIISNIENLLNKEPLADMVSWIHSKLEITQGDQARMEMMPEDDMLREQSSVWRSSSSSTSVITRGIYQLLSDSTIEVTELPIGRWTEDYKRFLDKNSGGKNGLIRTFRDFNTDSVVRMEIVVPRAKMSTLLGQSPHRRLKLETIVSLNNMVLFSKDGYLKKYRSALEILEEHADIRLYTYSLRKDRGLVEIAADLRKLQNRANFVQKVASGHLQLANVRKEDILREIRQFGLLPLSACSNTIVARDLFNENTISAIPSRLTETISSESKEDIGSGEYDYLLNMPLYSMTHERLQSLLKQVEEKTRDFQGLIAKTPESLWRSELRALRNHFRKQGITASGEIKMLNDNEVGYEDDVLLANDDDETNSRKSAS